MSSLLPPQLQVQWYLPWSSILKTLADAFVSSLTSHTTFPPLSFWCSSLPPPQACPHLVLLVCIKGQKWGCPGFHSICCYLHRQHDKEGRSSPPASFFFIGLWLTSCTGPPPPHPFSLSLPRMRLSRQRRGRQTHTLTE